ncbi:MAG: hypothetical protein IJK35_06510, partial [Oscillospiraceae bacterium]|nr:hypothetical protein [Oscillospiraceae bacterium]
PPPRVGCLCMEVCDEMTVNTAAPGKTEGRQRSCLAAWLSDAERYCAGCWLSVHRMQSGFRRGKCNIAFFSAKDKQE